MIIDCIPFFNELDLLELRLNELCDVVDVFVVSEATLTFSGKQKPLYFNDNKDRFYNFLKRIKHVVIDKYDGYELMHKRNGPRLMDRFQKRCTVDSALALSNFNGEDILIVSDCDEIPCASKIKEAFAANWEKATIRMPLYYYWMDCVCTDKTWMLAKLFRPTDASIGHNKIRYGKRRSDYVIKNGGWHFSFMGNIQEKLAAYSHIEYDTEPYNTVEYITERKYGGLDLFGRNHSYVFLDGIDHLPEYVKNNIHIFGKYIHGSVRNNPSPERDISPKND